MPIHAAGHRLSPARLVRSAPFAYAATIGSQTLLSFVTIPILVRLLGISEYGKWALIEPAVQTAAQVGNGGVNQGLLKNVSKDQRDLGEQLYIHLSCIQPLVIVVSILAGLIGFWFGMTATQAGLVGVMIWSESLLALILYGLRGARRPYLFGVVLLAKGGIVILVAGYGLMIDRSLLADAVHMTALACAAAVSSLAVGLYVARAASLLRVASLGAEARRVMGGSLRFGGPILLASLLMMSVTFSDRYWLSAVSAASEVGGYAVHQKLASAINVLAMPLGLWWPASRFAHMNDADGGSAFFARTAERILALFTVAALGLGLAIVLVYPLFAPGARLDVPVVSMLLVGNLMLAFSPYMNIGLFREGQTHWNTVIAAIAASLHFFVCFLLIPRFGLRGAASALVVAAAVSLILQAVLSARVHPVRWRLHRLIGIFAGCLIGGAAAVQWCR